MEFTIGRKDEKDIDYETANAIGEEIQPILDKYELGHLVYHAYEEAIN
jgi:hypothetical protein